MKNKPENVDLMSLRSRDEDIPATKVETSVSRRRRERREGRFIKLPLIWKDQFPRTKRLATLLVALHLLELDWKGARGAPVIFSNLGLEELGVSRQGKWRALIELETFGLITVERAKRRSPRVTLLKNCLPSGG